MLGLPAELERERERKEDDDSRSFPVFYFFALYSLDGLGGDAFS